MKIIKPSFELLVNGQPLTEALGIVMLKWVERNSRISHRSEEGQTEDSWKRFIKAVVIDHADWSVTEHASVTANLRVDRGFTHQLVRHRHFSFTQESTRFVNYLKRKEELEFIFPVEAPVSGSWHWNQIMHHAEIEYFELLSAGWKPQEARSVLPMALASTISVTGNLRNWRHFLLMRTSKETQADFKAITVPMLAEFQKCIPLLFDDIEVDVRQIDNQRKPR